MAKPTAPAPSARRETFVAVLAAFCALVGAPSAAHAQAKTYACIGQLMLFGGPYCPAGYVEANGQTLSIVNNQALFSLYGTTYGGNGTSTFGVPDLRGRAPVDQGQGPNLPNYALGQLAGSNTTTITQPNLPAVNPQVNAVVVNNPVPGSPQGRFLSNASGAIYSSTGTPVRMAAEMISKLGTNQPMTTQSPIVALRWCVAEVGVYCPAP